jgi:Glycosyl transferase family 2
VSERRGFSYVVPVRWADGADREGLADYLRWLRERCQQPIVVDGSPDPVFAANAEAWEGLALHVRPDPAEACLNGKVAGVMTGIRLATHEPVVIADDDVRYDGAALARTLGLLEEHDLVQPQNYFRPLPWHARWDTARTLLNRSAGRDYPGTLAVRRSRLLEIGGYDGDVLFENLELIRTVRARGGRAAEPLYVARVPPSAAHFWGQRTRQAYDDFAIPARMAAWLAIVPLLGLAAAARRPAPVAVGAGLLAALAEAGRRRAGGAAVFPAGSSLLAPVWALDRGVCAWLAVGQRLRLGGVRYAGSIIPRAANSERELRGRAA